MNPRGHDSDLAFARRNNARTVRPNQPGAAVLQILPRAYHIERRNALGNANDQFQLSIGGFHNRISRKWRRNENDRCIGASLADRFLDGVEDGPAFVSDATLAGSDSANDLGSVLRAGFRVKCAFPSSQSLYDDSSRFIYKNAHKIVSS